MQTKWKRNKKIFNKGLKFKNAKIIIETIDKTKFKSITISISGWFNVERKFFARMDKNLKQYIYHNIDKNLFHENKIIGTYEEPILFVEGKHKFMMFEYTLFVKDNIIPNSIEHYLKLFSKDLYNHFFNNPSFDIKLTNPKLKKEI